MTDQKQLAALQDRYQAACHAMQTGVAYDQEYNPKDKEPKHLRVGINVALCDMTALVHLLVSKGVITELEYWAAITEEMEREVGRYTEKVTAALKERTGRDDTQITLL